MTLWGGVSLPSLAPPRSLVFKVVPELMYMYVLACKVFSIPVISF